MVELHLDENNNYVCISHVRVLPCDVGDHHLISNWPTDIAKILGKIQQQKNDTNVYNFVGNKY